MDSIWWKKITKANLFAESIIDAIKNEKSVVLNLPRFVPWYNTLYSIVEEGIRNGGVQRDIKIFDISDENPGSRLLNDFCKQSVRDEYRIGISYAAFLATRPALTLTSTIVWAKCGSTKNYEEWIKFVTDYKKNLPKHIPGAIFIIETRDVDIPNVPGNIELLSFSSSISDYDKYTFCTLACSSANINPNIMPYIAELVSSVCTDDVELCAACIGKGEDFAISPIECIESIAVNCIHSDGSPFDIETIIGDSNSHMWESQIKYIFPLIERYRTEFIKKHRKDIERNLPLETAFGEIIETPEDAEIGLLYSIASTGGITMHSNEELPMLRFYRDMRNNLAHLKTIDFKSVCRILSVGGEKY